MSAPLEEDYTVRDWQTDWAAPLPPVGHPVLEYITEHFFGDETADNSIGRMCYLYKYFYTFAALFNPRYSHKVMDASLKAVRGKLPFLSNSVVDALYAELPYYNSLPPLNNRVDADEDRKTVNGQSTITRSGICSWWKHMVRTAGNQIPIYWIKVFQLVAIMQPSSAEVEHALSLLGHFFQW